MSEPRDFEEFWQHFLRSHGHPAVRWCHVAALACAGTAAVAAIARRRALAVAMGGAAVGLAVVSHYVFEGHGPENFGRPLWAGRAFVRLCVRTATGTIEAELKAAPPA